jgi:glucosamine--fructose-6-phosphate aminotransferase (isomerizing)
MHATWQDLEEFHHLNYFVVESRKTPAIVFASSNSRAWSRANELKIALGQLERPHVYVSDIEIDGVETMVVPKTREWFAPIVQSVPAALLAAHVAHRREIPHYRGHTGLWRGAQGAAFVKDSEILMASE